MSPEEYVDKLEQLLFDENELVTYKQLSKELKIHVNEAKKYLHEFLTVQNSKKEEKLYAYYFLSGTTVKDGVEYRKIVVVSEDNLEQVKAEFKEVTSCHIYSLNKGGCRDVSAIYNSQSWCKKWAEEHREFSAIKHPNIVKQAPIIKKAEIKKNDVKLVSSKPPVIKTKNDGPSAIIQNNSKESKNSLLSTNEKSTESVKVSENILSKSDDTVKSNSEPKDQKKSTLSSLWQKLEDKSKDGKNAVSKGDLKGKNKGPSKTLGKNNIMSMFSKQAEKNAANPVKKMTETVLPSKEPSIITEQETNLSLPKEKNHVENEKVDHKKSKPKASNKKNKRKSKQLDDESDEEVKPKKKKHRRICTMDDSDSESENEEELDRAQRSLTAEENNDVALPLSDDNEEPIPPTPPVILNKGKKKIWKTVQKTYQDEEGFLVAKQEKVLVSASDSDEDPLPAKETVNKTEPKQNTFLYRKQASLTSFFKQK